MITNNESLPNEVALLREDLNVVKQLLKELLNTTSDKADVINVDDVCRLSGYSKNTIYQYVNRNTIPFHKPKHGGRKLIFFRSEIENWLKGNPRESSEQYCERKELELVNHYTGGLN